MLCAPCFSTVVGTVRHSSFASVVGAVVDGDPPQRIRFVTAAFAEQASFRLQRDVSSLSRHLDIRVSGKRRSVTLPTLPIFLGSAGNGSWVHATLRRRGQAVNGCGWQVDAVIHQLGRLYAVASNGTAPVRGHGGVADAVHVAVLDLAQPGRALTTSGLPPHGRLAGCPVALLEASLGLVLDAGFVAARGGVDPAIVAAAAAISRTNAIFEDQLGLRLVVRVLIVNEQLGGDFAETGPNAAPAQGTGTRTCSEYTPRVVDGHGASVSVAGPNLALSRTAYWVQEHASRHAPVVLWHLLTDCFPRDGTTGLSEFGVLCEQGASAIRYADGGPENGLTSDGGCAGVSLSSLKVAGLGSATALSKPASPGGAAHAPGSGSPSRPGSHETPRLAHAKA